MTKPPPTVSAEERFDTIVRPEKPFNRFRLIVTGAIVIGLFGSALTADVNWARLPDVPSQLWNLAKLMFGNLDYEFFPQALEAMWESVAIAWIGTIIGAALSLPLALLAATNISKWSVVAPVRLVLNVLRAIPEIILAIVLIPVFGLGALAGTLAIGIGSIGTLGKLGAEIIEGCDAGPVEAADATGAGQVQRIRWAVLPQVMPDVLALWLYRFEINIRASAVLGVVGAGGIGGILQQTMAFREFGKAGIALIVVVGVTILIDTISGYVRRRIIRGPSGKPREAPAAQAEAWL
jgi:phosphonate transport system permease protein